MSSELLGRAARWLVERAGSDARVAELRAYLADASDHGERITPAEVGSLAVLAGRHGVRRGVADLPWWFTALPAAFAMFVLLGFTYETHFPAWDFVGADEVEWTSEARAWKSVVDVLTIVGVIGSLVAARRLVDHLRSGRLVLPALWFLSLIIAFSQTDLFVERNPWWDGSRSLDGLRSDHVNAIAPYSIGLFATFALFPLGFLVIDRLATRR